MAPGISGEKANQDRLGEMLTLKHIAGPHDLQSYEVSHPGPVMVTSRIVPIARQRRTDGRSLNRGSQERIMVMKSISSWRG